MSEELSVPTAAHMKPRSNPLPEPKRWENVVINVPPGDAEDEFDIASAKRPVFYEPGEAPKINFLHGEPDMLGEVTNCFEEPGILYRIVDKKTKTWAFYNDSLIFEIHVNCTFGKHSKLEALDNTTIKTNEEGQFVADLVVYPCETERFVSGYINGFTSKLRASPLSDTYFEDRCERSYAAQIKPEIEAIQKVAGDETDAEAILKICLEKDLKFVDLSFPPVQSSIAPSSSRAFKKVTWARPTQYVDPSLRHQIRLFRNPIDPKEINQGDLGDVWLMCAVATFGEDTTAIINMFRSPMGADQARRERAIGAYRVNFNKNGLWRSVIVDDYLPVVATSPKFAHSNDICELWPSILEKAFAKLHNGYSSIQSGDPVHALSDMSGFPSMRFDKSFEKAKEEGGHELFKKWVEWKNAGYQIMVTTPGYGPALNVGNSKPAQESAEKAEQSELLAGTGLVTGHAYTVFDAHDLSEEGHRVVKIRNNWPNGETWTGDWSPTSELWEKHPEFAQKVNFDPEDKTSMWMSWESALKYFIGGGVLFKQKNSFDYRIPLTFADCRPGVIFEVRVNTPTKLCLSLSNMDYRCIIRDPSIRPEYPPLMISVAKKCTDRDVYNVILNSCSDTTNPSADSWIFLEAREVSMIVNLEPEGSPYLIIPRMMDTDNTDGYVQRNDPNLVNRYQSIFPDAFTPACEVPVVFGIHSEQAFSGVGERGIIFRKLNGGNPVFENFPKFHIEDISDIENIRFQSKLPAKGYAKDKNGYYAF